MTDYLFTSTRLGFRTWTETDLQKLAEINADTEVMKFFPRTLTIDETRNFICRMEDQYTKNGYCYFAVEKIEDEQFIGFIGLSQQDFSAVFLPCADIGWRLKRGEWNKGFATEGAKACLDFAFNQLGLDRVISLAPIVNQKSTLIMNRIGMKKVKKFQHPRLHDYPELSLCVLYEKVNPFLEV